MPKAPPLPPQGTLVADPAITRACVREFTTFFNHMLTPEPNWSGVTDEQFVDAIAQSVMDIGDQRSGRGTAMLQTIIIELQDRLNQKIKG